VPVPASDAIASDVGHGALGVRYGLRPFRELLSETVGQRHLWVEFRPKKLLTTWASEGGGVYSKAVSETFDGIVLDVVGVQTLIETLARVESQALCAAGSFYYSGATLYIHLTAGADPAATSVVAQLGVHVGSHGVYQPVLLPDRLANGNLEAWTGTNPDSWTLAGATSAGSISLDKVTSYSGYPVQGSYAARITFAAATGYKSLSQTFTTLVAGGIYRVSGAYRNSSAVNGLKVLLYVWDTASLFILSDGRRLGAEFAFSDTAGLGEWRRFTFDFICPAWANVQILLSAETVSGTQTGTVDFDDVKLQFVSRFAYQEPLVSLESLPTIESSRADSFWGAMSSALGSLSLLNGGGRLEPLLSAYDWLGAEAVVRVGGRYQLGDNEIGMEDCPIIATGKLGAPTITDSGVTFELEDDRKLLLRTLPTRTYNNNGGTDAYTEPDRGRVRPLLFGTKTGIRPVQYDIHYPGGGPVPLGKYELVDCTDWPTGIKEITTVFWYADEDSATIRATSRRHYAPMAGADYSSAVSASLTTGRFNVLRDLHPIVITDENNKLVFDEGGAAMMAVCGLGTYRIYDSLAISGSAGLVKQVQTAMIAAGGDADTYCSFDDALQKVKLSKGAGTLNLLCASGGNAQLGLWAVLGFDARADKTGSTIYTADTVFTLQAFDQVIRVDAIGFKDDASGTYTGSAGATIEKAPDIARFLLRVILGVQASAIDLASFVAARAVATRPCSLYLGASRTVADVFAELETSGNMDLVLVGGVWYCYPRDTSIPVGTPELVDADFLSFESKYDPTDLYGTVTLTYNESPDGGDPVQFGQTFIGYRPLSRSEMGEVTDPEIALRHGRPDQRTFRTCLRDAADATTAPSSRLQEIATQASTLRRRFTFQTKGKALQVPVNGKIQLTRARGLDTTGALSSVLVRVISKRDDWARWVSDVVAIEVV
jgi:hypothetical protein